MQQILREGSLRKSWKALPLLFALLFFSLCSRVAWSQSIVTGGINGTVLDTSGAVVAGASLTVKSDSTGETFNTTSSGSGTFEFALLKPGDYTLTIAKNGFKTATKQLTVRLGQITNANISLEVGSRATTIEVTVGSRSGAVSLRSRLPGAPRFLWDWTH